MSTFREELDSLIERYRLKGQPVSEKEALAALEGNPSQELSQMIADGGLAGYLVHCLREYDKNRCYGIVESSPESEKSRENFRERLRRNIAGKNETAG